MTGQAFRICQHDAVWRIQDSGGESVYAANVQFVGLTVTSYGVALVVESAVMTLIGKSPTRGDEYMTAAFTPF